MGGEGLVVHDFLCVSAYLSRTSYAFFFSSLLFSLFCMQRRYGIIASAKMRFPMEITFDAFFDPPFAPLSTSPDYCSFDDHDYAFFSLSLSRPFFILFPWRRGGREWHKWRFIRVWRVTRCCVTIVDR